MSMSRGWPKRWVIDNMSDLPVRYAKSLAAEHGVRVADVVYAAILDLWDAVQQGQDDGKEWNMLVHQSESDHA